MAKIIYSRGFPYGAPLVTIRGGATRDADIRAYLKQQGFRWDNASHGWKHYLDRSDLFPVLLTLRECGCEVLPKDGMDRNYVLDLDNEGRRP